MVHRPSTWDTQAQLLWQAGSVAACGILVPQQGIDPPSPALEGGFLTTGPPGKSLLPVTAWNSAVTS